MRTTPSFVADGAPALSALLDPLRDVPPPSGLGPEDQDVGDLQPGVNEDALADDDLDFDQVASRE